ncbi:SRPBCC family protein [Micromonospora rifamycinica]|uniref:SRPBCC family protein n=1 Tax=Micromonospora rifamycinica TaxID=291594 RepID=UPI0034414364
MTGTPTGQLFRTLTGTDLVLVRTFRAPIEDVWRSVTEPDRTARWFGRWEGDAAPGRTIRLQMAFEDGTPWTELRIEACDAPRHLSVSAADESGGWRIELLLTETAGTTELRFTHHLDSEEHVGEIGPGWEYYLDLLVAAGPDAPAVTGSAPDAAGSAPGVDFGDYYPAMKPYFDQLRTSTT